MNRYRSFQREILKAFTSLCGKPNLLPHQRATLEWLGLQYLFVVINCDKNFGPAILEKRRYCTLVYRPLTDTGVYKLLTKGESTIAFSRIKLLVRTWTFKYTKTGTITKSERRFFRHSASLVKPETPFSIFYLMPKIHKVPLQVRPVVSYSGSFLYALGVWCDDKLQVVAQQQRSYFKSSYVLLQELLKLDLPPQAHIFTADATAMYTNIPTGPALRNLSRYLQDHEEQFPGVPQAALFDALSIVMRNYIFTFGDTFWHQTNGAAMGAPPSPSWATMYFAPHEDECVDAFPRHILFYRQFIDDIFGIWIDEPTASSDAFTRFQTKMNECEGMIWTFSSLTDTVDFMDVTLSLCAGRITSSLYEKKLNHHLYIPPHSSHPPGVSNGLISGLVFRIITLCTDEDVILVKLHESFRHLKRRGYTSDRLTPLFHAAIANAHAYDGTTTTMVATTNPSPIFLKLAYHPRDPPPAPSSNASGVMR
jgi:hypothetical protein